MALNSRPPTGQPSLPVILLEGPSKSGRTVAAAMLSTHPMIGDTYVAQIATTAWDDYGVQFPNVNILVHNGTVSSIEEQIAAAAAAPRKDGKPTLVVVDEKTDLWDIYKNLAETRQRRSEKTKRQLAEDPDAEIDVTQEKWNAVKGRIQGIVHDLRRANCIAVLIVRSGEVTKVVAGRPMPGEFVYRAEVEKSIPSLCTMRVRMEDDHSARLMSATTLRVEIPVGGLKLVSDNPLAEAIMAVSGGAESWADGAALVVGQNETIPKVQAKKWLVAELRRLAPDMANPNQIAGAMWAAIFDGQDVGTELTDAQHEALRAEVPKRIGEMLGHAVEVAAPVEPDEQQTVAADAVTPPAAPPGEVFPATNMERELIRDRLHDIGIVPEEFNRFLTDLLGEPAQLARLTAPQAATAIAELGSATTPAEAVPETEETPVAPVSNVGVTPAPLAVVAEPVQPETDPPMDPPMDPEPSYSAETLALQADVEERVARAKERQHAAAAARASERQGSRP